MMQSFGVEFTNQTRFQTAWFGVRTLDDPQSMEAAMRHSWLAQRTNWPLDSRRISSIHCHLPFNTFRQCSRVVASTLTSPSRARICLYEILLFSHRRKDVKLTKVFYWTKFVFRTRFSFHTMAKSIIKRAELFNGAFRAIGRREC